MAENEEQKNEFDHDNDMEYNEDDDDDENDELKIGGSYYPTFLEACKKGDLEKVKRCVDKKVNINGEKNDKSKWTPLIWACTKGHTNVVRYLLSKGAAKSYLPENQESPAQKAVKMGSINDQVRPTPLQWACSKSQLQCVWLLLKEKLSWEDIDQFGNNCIHLAASGDNVAVFETLMMYGVSVDAKNTRGHECIDLATQKDIIHMIKKHKSTKQCSQLKTPFSDEVYKHLCGSCKNFFCKEYYRIEWIYENKDSEERDKLEGKCLQCWTQEEKHELGLKEDMENYQHKRLAEKMEFIDQNCVEIDVKLLEQAKVLMEKLRTQDIIMNKIDSLKVVENYRTILKSVNIVKDMVDDAKHRNIDLDQKIMEKYQKETGRLYSERQLRFQLDNLIPSQAQQTDVTHLDVFIQQAKEQDVALIYVQEAEVLRDKMQKNLTAKDIFKKFDEYPLREYPDPIIYDKNGKPIDPVTKKPIDPKKLAPPPKKKKKEPKFVFPEWSNNGEVVVLQEKIVQLQNLLKEKEQLEIDDEFVKKSTEVIKRLNREVTFRKQQDEEARLAAEKKAADKKKKK